MLSKYRDRRRNRRYGVRWAARLRVRFSDDDGGEMAVDVADISGSGALIRSPRMDLNGRHLTVASPLPHLTLTMETEAGPAISEVEIRWYRWSVSDDRFEIGLLFTHMPKESRDRIDRLIKALKKSGAPPV